jgi:chromate reductase, NAD(P)H dehydrogenase (quinone)
MTEDGKMQIATICGSIREKAFNRFLLRSLPALSPGEFVLTECPLIVNIPHYDGDLQMTSGIPSAVAQMTKQIRESDGLIIVSPEYNYSVPGPLKNAIDWMSRVAPQPLARKPVLIQSASTGIIGGGRMQYHLRQILVSLDAHVMTRPEIMIGQAATKFNETGFLADVPTREAVQKQLLAFRDFISSFVRAEQA